LKLLDKYILREFLRFFLITCITFIALYLLIDFFEKIRMFLSNKATTVKMASYFLYSIPIIISLTLPFAILWDDKDIRSHALMTDAVHRHGSLAGIELWHGGACTMNRTSRIAPLSPSGMPWMSTHLGFMGNQRPKVMDNADIQDLLRWQAAGARRAMQAGFDTEYIKVEDIGWDESRHVFTDLDENPIYWCFKLYPWEWMRREEFGPHLLEDTCRWLEPPWKSLLSNKAILPILWELFPDSPNLLESSFEPLPGGDFVQKPILGREGANVQIFEHGKLSLQTEGPYDGPSVCQKLCRLPQFDGQYVCIGSWIVNGWSCGLGLREDATPVTGNLSRFVPHLY